jgi:hypothetical protein
VEECSLVSGPRGNLSPYLIIRVFGATDHLYKKSFIIILIKTALRLISGENNVVGKSIVFGEISAMMFA